MGRRGTGEGQESSRERDDASIQEATNPIAPYDWSRLDDGSYVTRTPPTTTTTTTNIKTPSLRCLGEGGGGILRAYPRSVLVEPVLHRPRPEVSGIQCASGLPVHNNITNFLFSRYGPATWKHIC